jgi:uncharacterized membrane protein
MIRLYFSCPLSRILRNGIVQYRKINTQAWLMQRVAEFLSVFCSSLFAGAALYVSHVEHPARMECGTELAATEFPPSYRRAAVMQASLAILGFLFSMAAWLSGSTVGWVLAGALLFLAVPFTLVIIMPTNRALLDPSLDKSSPRTYRLLTQWGRLHAVRTVLSLLSLALFLFLLVA